MLDHETVTFARMCARHRLRGEQLTEVHELEHWETLHEPRVAVLVPDESPARELGFERGDMIDVQWEGGWIPAMVRKCTSEGYSCWLRGESAGGAKYFYAAQARSTLVEVCARLTEQVRRQRLEDGVALLEPETPEAAWSPPSPEAAPGPCVGLEPETQEAEWSLPGPEAANGPCVLRSAMYDWSADR